MFDLTDSEEDVAITAVVVSLVGALLLDFIAGTIFGVVAIMSGLEDWLIGVIEKIV